MIKISQDGNVYALGHNAKGNYVLAIYNLASDTTIFKLENKIDKILSISPNSELGAALSDDIIIYDIETEIKLWTFNPNFEVIHSLCFSPDGKLFAAAGEFETDCDYDDLSMTSVALWDIETGKNLWEHRCGLFKKILFSPNGTKLYGIGTADVNRNLTSKVNCAKVSSGGFREIFREKLRLRFWDFDLSPDGNLLVCSGGYYHYKQDKVPLIIVDLTSEKKKIKDSHGTYFTKDEMKRLIRHTDTINAVAYSPDGKTVASASSDDTIRIWDVKTSGQIYEITKYTKNITFSPDGSIFAFLNRGKLFTYNTGSWNLIKQKKLFG